MSRPVRDFALNPTFAERALARNKGFEIPEGYETLGVGNAKNHAYSAIVESLELVGVDPHPEPGAEVVDIIDMADRVIEALRAAGVEFPDSIPNPKGFFVAAEVTG